ncbi:DNA polymerase III subunit gamma-like [Ylistrum balloti]|uniref:DNA polymerase III subunit gamma-like n=1 Tax=Ylistrum balloti TaxID=509963 RepID=UPI0029058EE8|nr:DNA polymerase III subunit gamma-like [Ylistrum balloti]
MDIQYENTANKLRPQNFDALVGQDFVITSLQGEIESKTIAHAYLLSGPRGVGKTSLARLIALAVNRPDGQDFTTLEYEGSMEIRGGSSLDVIEIDGASYTSVENVRKIREEVLYAPVKCKYKIYIIDEVHMLSHSAFNALLKTIEEPPPYIIFIFATTELDKVPLTIRSRCQQFTLHLIPINIIVSKLHMICKERNITADDEALHWVAKEARGSLRDAYVLFDQIIAFSGSNITLQAIEKNLGLAGIDTLSSLFLLCIEKKRREVQELLASIFEKGTHFEKLLSEACEYLRNILLIKNGLFSKQLLGYSIDQFDKMVYTQLSVEQIEYALRLLLECYRNSRYSIEPRFEIELVFSVLCTITEHKSINMVIQDLQTIQSDIANTLSETKTAGSITQAQQDTHTTANSPATETAHTTHTTARAPTTETTHAIRSSNHSAVDAMHTSPTHSHNPSEHENTQSNSTPPDTSQDAVQKERGFSQQLAQRLSVVHDSIRSCSECGNISENDICAVCSDVQRNRQLLCVVASIQDVLAVESCQNYLGLYHVLGGLIDPLEGVGPEDLAITALQKRIEGGMFKEIILATPPSINGEVTARYIINMNEDKNYAFTRIAQGIPRGGNFEFTDKTTLAYALEARRQFK